MPVTNPARSLTNLVERASILDTPAGTLGRLIRRFSNRQGINDALSGTWLGHPVHPPATDVVIGCLMSASFLDFIAPRSGARAARRLLAAGVITAAPTAVTGLSDWADTELSDDRARRVGLVHAGVNICALLVYAASWNARRRGSQTKGTALALAGGGALGFAGYLGGHLTYIRGVGVNQTAFDPGPRQWTPVAAANELIDGEPRAAEADGTPILLARYGSTVYAIHDRCSHRGCLLSSGDVDGEAVICSCHGSQFDLRDGAVLRGPATARQPAFEIRENAGQIEVRRQD